MAIDPNESSELESTISKLKDPYNKTFIKNLTKVPARVDTFQDRSSRRGSMMKHYTQKASALALTEEQRSHKKELERKHTPTHN